MAGMKSLVGRKMTKTVKFMNENVEINKLSVNQVLEIQTVAKNAGENENGLELLKMVIKQSVQGAEDLTDEDFNSFPMDELTKLSNEIMKFSGIGAEQQGK